MQKILNLFKQNFRESQNPAMGKQLQSLQASLKNTLRFLNKTSIKKNGRNIKLNRLPWVLVIGATGAGKSSLLANSNINFILDKTRKENTEELTVDSCKWWVTRDVVLIDVPGNYISNSFTNDLWEAFLDHVYQLRGNKGVRGIILTLSLTEMMDKTNREQIMGNLQYRLTQLRSQFGTDLPVYLTLTKCDLLPGFQDFFNDLAIDELAQVWGFSFNTAKESLADACAKRFDALINRLNKQLIWRLHQERNVHARTYIKDFPLQLERVKENCVEIIKTFMRLDNNFTLKGLYLTSALQNENKAEEYPQTVSADAFQRSMEIMNTSSIRKQAYFVKQFILQSIVPADSIVIEHEWPLNFIIIVMVLCIGLMLAGFQGKDFLSNLNLFSAMRNDKQKETPIYQASLPNVNAMKNISQQNTKLLNEKKISKL